MSDAANERTNQPLNHSTAMQLMQNELEDKVIYTSAKIEEWYEAYGDAFVAFSGGKDSTVLADIAARTLNRYKDKRYQLHLVFCDTGLEYPEIKAFVREYVEFLKNKYPDLIIDLDILRPKKRFDQVIKEFGYPVVSKMTADYASTAQRNPDSYRAKCLRGEVETTFLSPKWSILQDAPFKVSAYCCDVMKKKPVHAYTKQTGRYPITAVMACESRNRYTEWLRTGCNAYEGMHKMSKPMSFWTEQDVLKYIDDYHLPMCSVYGDIVVNGNKYETTGCHRTGCIFCAFGAHKEKEPNRFQLLKQTHPVQYDYCMRPIESGGLGMAEVLAYIGVKTDYEVESNE